MLLILIEDDKHEIKFIVSDEVESATEMLIVNERIGMFCKYFCEKYVVRYLFSCLMEISTGWPKSNRT